MGLGLVGLPLTFAVVLTLIVASSASSVSSVSSVVVVAVSACGDGGGHCYQGRGASE
jgi:hypothetical protein